jgi:hypothetical protein
MNLLNHYQIETFNQDGFLVIPNFYSDTEVTPILFGIWEVIGEVIESSQVLLQSDRSIFSGSRFDRGYVELIHHNRRLGGIIYDAVKQIPAFIRLVSNEKNEYIFQSLRPNSKPGIAGRGYGIRINNPFEEKYRAPWHQEYPAQLRSMNGIVFWSPLINVVPDNGPVDICVSSHKLGPLPVHRLDPSNPEKQGAYALRLKDEEHVIKDFEITSPCSNPGDLIIMDFHLIHRSGKNISHRALWSMQFRYFDFSESTGKKHGWPGSFTSGLDFQTIHPELCVE